MNLECFNKILVVEDSTASLQLLMKRLSEQGYIVYPASNGELALEFLQSTLPDLILLDIKMPGMNGYEVCRRLKVDERLASIPVIFLSALEDEHDKVQGFQAGGVDYITKPFHPEELLARVGTHLRLRELTEGLEQQVNARTEDLTIANKRLQKEITEHRYAEEELKRTNERLALATSAGHMGVWDWDIVNDKLIWDDRMFELYGIKREDFTGAYQAWLHSVHPEDRAASHEFSRRTMQGEHEYDTEFRIVWPDGSIRFIKAYGHITRDTEHRPVRVTGVNFDITERKAAEAQIEFLACYDALTGLLNRALIQDRIQAMLANARRRRNKLALLFVDLDKFKTVNDSLGHAVGDGLLVEVAMRLKRWTREQDAIARLGGDEFLVVAPDILEVADVTAAANRIIDSMRTGFLVGDHMLNVTCSIGISLFPEHGADADTLMKNADAAMYYSKLSGRNTYNLFSEEMSAEAAKRFALQNSMRAALDNGEFFVVYQPQLDIATGKISGCEALLRWMHPELGLVPPEEFIPVAESSGLIVPIGRWLLRTVCRQARQWRDEALPALPIAVNVSAFEISRTDFFPEIKAAIMEAEISPECLELELTESLLISNAESIREMLRDMKNIGLKLSIDDFGTGYSNLSYLRRLPIYKLKIDRSFVEDLTLDPDDTAITRTIIAMAKSLNLKVLAEGVETPIQMSFLRDHGCDEVQGFLFSKPLGAAELAKKIRKECDPLGNSHVNASVR